MTTVGTAVTAAAVVTAGVVFAVVMVVVVTLGFGVIVELKLCGMTEVLKDLSVFISYCNFHCIFSISTFLSDFLN